MDFGEIAIRGLERDVVHQLSRRSDSRGLTQLGAHGVLLIGSGALVWACRGTLWLLPASIVHGIILSFLFCALHESIHRTAFANRRLNDLVSWVCGTLLLLPPEYFRLFHFAHHRHTQDPARDPELSLPAPSSLASYAWRVCGLPYWFDRLGVTLRHALMGRVNEAFVPAMKRAWVVREARILWAFYGVVLLVSLLTRRTDALLYWLFPAVLGQPFLRLFLMAEHTGCSQSEDSFSNTRTTYTSGVIRLLTWRMSYHAEHHAYPSVPFHALLSVNTLVRDRIAYTAPGYRSVHRNLLRSFSGHRAARNARITSP